MEKYEEANVLLKKIPDTVIDATIMKTSVLAHQEGTYDVTVWPVGLQ